MNWTRGDTCYILENNMSPRQAKIISKQGNFYVIQLVGSCGAIRLKEGRLFESEEAALASKKENEIPDRTHEQDIFIEGYVDVFAGKRKGRDPHKYQRW